jgi:N-acetylmuramoyl-L-alanine amidase
VSCGASHPRSSRGPVLAALLGLLAPLPLLAQEAARVEVTVDRGENSTRLLLTHSRSPNYVIQSSRGRIAIRYAEPIVLEPPELRFEDDVLQSCKLRDDTTIVLDLGRAYDRYESFELRNPHRLVLDLKRRVRRGEREGPPRHGPLAEPDKIIVIDPGHGGVEHGAVGPTGLEEKEVALALARNLKHALQRADPGISVVLTRDEDRLLGLDERTAIANHNRADLFVSIHVNASPALAANGAETYFLASQATDDEARTLAALENRAASSTASEAPPGKLDLVLWDLAQNQYLAESAALAEAIQGHLNLLTGTRNRGVRQAPFRVLMGATMPAVLVEVGFISNPEEEAKLRTPSYQRQVVAAMTAAIREFLANLRRFEKPGAAGEPQVPLP